MELWLDIARFLENEVCKVVEVGLCPSAKMAFYQSTEIGKTHSGRGCCRLSVWCPILVKVCFFVLGSPLSCDIILHVAWKLAGETKIIVSFIWESGDISSIFKKMDSAPAFSR